MTGGSPCQDLSIAGKRAGLAGARSGLFMEQVRIVKEMREADKRNGRTGDMVRPRFLVWENVVGAFSSNRGKDFAAVLEEIIKIVEPEAPGIEVPEKGWPTWGGYHDEMGGRWSVVWRTHDAQYWGVPQRRRRISVVADFGGDTASEIQFDPKSVSGDIAESGEAGEGFAEAAEAGASYAVRIRGGCDGGGKGALVQTEKSGTLGTGNDQTIFQSCITPWDCQSKRIFGTSGEAPTLQGGIGGGVNNPAIFCMDTQQGGAELRTDDRAPTLTAAAGMSGNNQPVAAIPINDKATRWQGGGESRNHDGSGNGLGIGKEGDPSPTLTAGDRHGVMCGNQVPLTYQDVTGTLSPGAHAGSYNGQDAYNDMLVCSSIDCRNFQEGGEVNGALQAKESGGQSLNLNNTVRQNMVVRRLTPMECERLQGFPDHWTDIGEWTDEKGKKHKDADSPRYKALGNSIALPFWDWMLRRMARYLPADATLGSLFDGIAGFPLIWERIHGKGTARWASEIEPFPIAVTKKHFPEEE